MADFMAPIVEWLLGVLQEDTPDLLIAAKLEPFAEFRKSWTFAFTNWPPVGVMARKSEFDPEGTARHSYNDLTIKFGVQGGDPDQVNADAMTYMKAIDDAITPATWLPQISHVHIAMHDYGPLWEKGGTYSRFPEMHLEVEVYEL